LTDFLAKSRLKTFEVWRNRSLQQAASLPQNKWPEKSGSLKTKIKAANPARLTAQE
jgi:hypothetical protein